jgi:hypothetical protein
MNISLTPPHIVVIKYFTVFKMTPGVQSSMENLNFLHHNSLIMYPESDDGSNRTIP